VDFETPATRATSWIVGLLGVLGPDCILRIRSL
jgi:hypothetical protein